MLHTKEPTKDDDMKIGSRMRVGRSCSGGVSELGVGAPPSPPARRAKPPAPRSPAIDLTVFRVPGLDVKVHYESKTVSPSPGEARKVPCKKAALFAWLTLQSIPEETVISPHILEFLEQTLEPLPPKHEPQPQAETSRATEDPSYNQYVYASFPVDVIVHFHMQPSTFRFSCLPASRVECLLQLPSLQIVASSKRATDHEYNDEGSRSFCLAPVDVMVHFHMQPSTFRFSCLPASRVECLLQLPSLQIVASSKRATDQDVTEPAIAMGGLSVTGCLADFSVYIFHPYGGKKSSVKEAQWSPLSDTERKDSLSVNVEFVKFHLSRSRKLDHAHNDQSKATVRFSTIVDIGSASFKYDMRRLSEILAFPKAWYRRTIVRRMFLGDLSINQPHEASPQANNVPVSPVLPQRERAKTMNSQASRDSTASMTAGNAAWETLVLFAVNFTKLNVQMNMGNVMGNVSWLSNDFNCTGRLGIGSTGHRNMLVGVALGGSSLDARGGIPYSCLSNEFHCTGRLGLGSTGHRNMLVGVALGGSSLDARGGIVGGAISLSSLDTYVHIEEEPGRSPGHVAGLSLGALELRLEYMGGGVLMARVSRLQCKLRDEWREPAQPRGSLQYMARVSRLQCKLRDEWREPAQPRGPSIILLHGALSWHQLQILMSRSSTPELLKMQLKLEEFFSQQFKSSRRVFSSLQGGQGYRGARARAKDKGAPPPSSSSAAAPVPQPELRHHRHWQKVLQLITGVRLTTLPETMQCNGTVLGGTMELQGTNVSLACFHGNSFKAKSWALFSLKEPCISFATEAQQRPNDEGEMEVHVVQSLTASLGSSSSAGARHQSMGTVCRMTRALLFPPQFKTLREWFHYAFANSEIDAIENFPSIERDAPSGPNTSSVERDRERDRERRERGAADKHVREVIFALPALRLLQRTDHRQRAQPPTENDKKPVVDCSFMTEFEDHIFVSVDAEAFLFLHDLISSYIKEKDRVMAGTGRSAWGENGTTAAAGDDCKPSLPQDYRDYNCLQWHLEPTVRLLSWGGKSIEPYGVDYILQKLGFSHARTTIPKWLQRGTLDPLDKLLSLVLLRLVAIVPHK
ncbi:hypothetical protein JYU34_002256 [Plutella xylostella]|nr:hypothetical protein JYU34_002256 [Plutella xylostella]